MNPPTAHGINAFTWRIASPRNMPEQPQIEQPGPADQYAQADEVQRLAQPATATTSRTASSRSPWTPPRRRIQPSAVPFTSSGRPSDGPARSRPSTARETPPPGNGPGCRSRCRLSGGSIALRFTIDPNDSASSDAAHLYVEHRIDDAIGSLGDEQHHSAQQIDGETDPDEPVERPQAVQRNAPSRSAGSAD